jgi:two-component system, response regulator
MKVDNSVEILLIEDNNSDAELTIRALKKANIANKLIHLKDGVEALDFIFARGAYTKYAYENYPKLILLDIKMPKVDGIEVLKQLKANEKTKQIPVVVMTSSKEEQDIVNSYKLGVNSYVVKPVEFENFAKAVADLGWYWLLLNQPTIDLSRK